MKRLLRRKDLRLWLILPTSLVSAVLVSFFLAGSWSPLHSNGHSSQMAKAAKVVPGLNFKTVPPTPSRFSESLLTDSILSIIQSYYVDPDRVDNHGLVDAVLGALATSPEVKSGRLSTGAGESIWIDVGGDRRQFNLRTPPEYQEVLALFNQVAVMLDHKQVMIPTAEPTEKNAPGSVVLLNSLLSALDSHSSLLSPDAYRELRQGTEGSFGGLGVLVGIRENVLTVIKPLPRSPAQRAGIRKYDRILGIDGVYTYGFTLDELVEYMRGDPGTDVKLSLLRDGATAPSEMILQREIIHVDSVTSADLTYQGSKVLHLTIENFASRTSREVLTAIKKFKLRHNGVLNGVVLDLRSNPGGLLDQAVQVSDLFLQDGVIVTTRGRRDEVEAAGSGFDEVDFPLLVLVDGDSASASEIVAGALQDHGRALVIGQPSFGKGSVQTIFELPGERALKLTIARYYTPDGRSIQNVGIIPDIWLQPIYKGRENSNLFGSYRYKNERFLRNHLLGHANSKTLHDSGLKQPAQKVYYLAEAPVDPEDPLRRVDREMDLALKIINDVRQTYGDKLPASAGRASHWLGLAGPSLSKEMEKMGQEAQAWLAQQFRFDWPMVAPVNPDADISLALNNVEPQVVKPGSAVTLQWRITNNEAVPLEHLSLFVRSDVAGFDTKEVLLGSIAAKASQTGTLTVEIPSYFEPGPVLLRLGAAVDAWPALRASADVPIEVQTRQVASLSASAVISHERGGKVRGSLETTEKARLRIDIGNLGAVAAHDLKILVTNLSGKQIKILDKPLLIKELAPNAHVESFVEIEASRALYTTELGLGLYIDSPDLKLPFRQRIVLPGVPTVIKPAEKMLSH